MSLASIVYHVDVAFSEKLVQIVTDEVGFLFVDN